MIDPPQCWKLGVTREKINQTGSYKRVKIAVKLSGKKPAKMCFCSVLVQPSLSMVECGALTLTAGVARLGACCLPRKVYAQKLKIKVRICTRWRRRKEKSADVLSALFSAAVMRWLSIGHIILFHALAFMLSLCWAVPYCVADGNVRGAASCHVDFFASFSTENYCDFMYVA